MKEIISTTLLFYKEHIKRRARSEKNLPSFPIKQFINLKLNLALSHNDYLNNIGGTEKVIYEQSLRYRKMDGTRLLHVFPSALDNQTTKYGVNLDESFVGFYDVYEIVEELKKISFENIFLHHLIGSQNISIISGFLSLSSKNKPTAYLHDFYTICPNVNLRCFNSQTGISNCIKAKCKIPETSSCSTWFHPFRIYLWRKLFIFILKKCQVIAPSEFLKEIYSQNFGLDKIQVKSPAILQKNNQSSLVSPARLRVAFLGYDAEHKGIAIWEKLVTSLEKKSDIEFFHIGRAANKLPNVTYMSYNFKLEGSNRPVEILLENSIQCVLLISQVPESFSFTLHEALAADCFILTTVKSGNIAYVIKNNPAFGKVFQSDLEIEPYLLAMTQNYQKEVLQTRQISAVLPNPEI